MASAEQIKALIQSHYASDSERFTTMALQVAAAEARKGHNTLAADIKGLVDKSQRSKARLRVLTGDPDLTDLLQFSEPRHRLSELVARQSLKDQLKRVVVEFHQRAKLAAHGLQHRRKVLLAGPPGTGKTMTAGAIAHELGLPFCVIHTDRLITKFMGETASKLRQVFEHITNHTGVYFFDEFDAIGTERARENDVGEMRRVLNSFLQFLEQNDSDSFVLAATNHFALLDQALYRRFDDVLFYELPTDEQVVRIITNRLANFPYKFKPHTLPKSNYSGLSHAEVTQACDDAIKAFVLNEDTVIRKDTLTESLLAKRRVYDKT